jgi:hypothetical protein
MREKIEIMIVFSVRRINAVERVRRPSIPRSYLDNARADHLQSAALARVSQTRGEG